MIDPSCIEHVPLPARRPQRATTRALVRTLRPACSEVCYSPKPTIAIQLLTLLTDSPRRRAGQYATTPNMQRRSESQRVASALVTDVSARVPRNDSMRLFRRADLSAEHMTMAVTPISN
jgi:hypothetical protein